MRRHVMWLGVLALLLGGCGGQPDAAPAPTPPKSTAPVPASDSTRADASPPIELWEVDSEDGAVAFAEHWIDVFNEASSSGETAKLSTLSDGACQTCQALISRINDIYAGGGYVKSRGWSVRTVSVTPLLPAHRPQISLNLSRPPQLFFENGKRTRFVPGPATLTARLSWHGSWRMESLLEYE